MEIREYIDVGIFRLAVAQAIISGNSGGSWTASGKDWDDLVEKLGVAKVAVENDYYAPSAFVASKTNAERISNWTGLTEMGFRMLSRARPGSPTSRSRACRSSRPRPCRITSSRGPPGTGAAPRVGLAADGTERPLPGRVGDGLLLPSRNGSCRVQRPSPHRQTRATSSSLKATDPEIP